MYWGERVVQGSVSRGGPKLMSWGGGGGVWCRDKRRCPGGERVVQGSVSRGGPK